MGAGATRRGDDKRVADSQQAAKLTLALKKAPPPPSSRRAQAHRHEQAAPPNPKAVSQRSATPSPAPSHPAPSNTHRQESADPARHTDAQWAADLEIPRDVSPRLNPTAQPEPPLPEHLPLLNLEGEISALRPRPSELPPEPGTGLGGFGVAPHSEGLDGDQSPAPLPEADLEPVAPYRGRSTSDLSVLYQALPTNYPDRSAGSVAARSSNVPRSRGYVPKAPHEFLPPPPPPNKRQASKSFSGEEEDEAPTQARRPVYPYELHTPTPHGVLTPQALRESTPAPAMPVGVAGPALSPTPPPASLPPVVRLPPAPALPGELHVGNTQDFTAEASWDDREWTDAKQMEAIHSGFAPQVHGPVYPTPPPPAMAPIPAMAPTMGAPHLDSVRPTALTVPAPTSKFPHFGLPTGWAPVVGASVLGAAMAAGAFLLPERGQLLIDVSNQSWASLRDAQVYVNDELVCTQSPCAVKVDAAPQRVRVTAPGYQPSADESVLVAEGAVTLHKIQLGASADTGIEVQTSVPNLQLYVDGRRIGSLPRKVMGLPPGEHTVVITGGDNFTEERRIQLQPNQTLVINDLEPKVQAKSAEPSADDDAAEARVVSESEKATDHEEEARGVRGRARWQPSARTRALAEDVPSSGTAKASVAESSESRETSSAPSNSADNSALGAAMRQSVGLPANPTPSEKSQPKASGTGSLHIVTNPPAMILLDGKPVGKTPQRLTVSAGTHSVVLIHENGRKRASINVESGANKTIKASF